MNTKPLYLEDVYQKTCTAKIIDLVVNKDRCIVVLDQTIFYPEGGGQPCDQGTIKSDKGNLRVDKVSLNGDKIMHEGKIQGEFKTGETVECEIDWDRRFKNMQMHTAGHILHEAVKSLIPDCNPLGAEHGKHAYFIYEGKISEILESRMLIKANEIIDQNLPIQTQFVSLEELQKRASWLPAHLPTNKPLRIMWIGNYDPIPDGGTQVNRTSEITKFSEIKITPEGENTKISYKLGFEEVEKNHEDYSFISNIDLNKIQNIKNEALAQIISSNDQEELSRLKIHYLGKNGILAQLAKDLPNLSPLDRIDAGKTFNDAKTAIENAINSKSQIPNHKSQNLDETLPGIPVNVGLLHPISAVAREMNDIFQSLGFSVADGPEIEDDEYNYNRLNLPLDHPARDLQDSLYIKEPDILLRTHTSSLEAHILATHKPPFRFVFPGKSYRYENVSASNHMIFFQYEGIAVGENITMANLKSTLETFIHIFFGPNRKSRFRCKYYPQVEPGIGVDIDCQFCNQRGCSVCKNRGWVEMLGGGMVHPNMFKVVGLDPFKYSGFAWGMGLDRITMARYKINDIRALFNGNLVYKI